MLDPSRQDAQTPAAPAITPPSAARRPMIVTLIVASALSPLAINIFLPSMTSIARDLNAGTAAVGLGLSLYLAAMAPIQLIAGPLSDRYGRRPIILGGICLFLLGTLLCVFAPTIELFLVGRVIQAASATGIVLSRAIVRDLYSREQSASMIGYVTMGLAVAPMIGPAIGGILDTVFGWRATFWMLGVIGLLTLALLLFDLSETNARRGAPIGSQFRSYRILFSAPQFWAYTGSATFTSVAFFAFLGGAPFVAVQTLGMTPAEYGLWFMLCPLGYIAGNFLTGRLSQRVGLRPLLVSGAALTLAGSLLMLAFYAGGLLSPLTLFAPMVLSGIGNGLCIPNATAGAVSVRPEAAGAASGLLGASQIGTGALVSVVAASVSATPTAVPAVMAGGALLGLVSSLLVIRERAQA